MPRQSRLVGAVRAPSWCSRRLASAAAGSTGGRCWNNSPRGNTGDRRELQPVLEEDVGITHQRAAPKVSTVYWRKMVNTPTAFCVVLSGHSEKTVQYQVWAMRPVTTSTVATCVKHPRSDDCSRGGHGAERRRS